MKKGFTLIDVLVGSGLMVIVFLGIFGAYQLGMKVVGQSKNKITATAIANQWVEKVRNLPYESIGVRGGFPDGVLEAATSTAINGNEYSIGNRVDFVVDQADGLSSPQDACPNDYKRFEVKISWAGRFGGEVRLSTDISPKNLAQECSIQGGILGVSVFDAFGNPVSLPFIEIKNPVTGETLKTAAPITGEYNFSLATSTYKVVVSKSGYSREQTFSSGEIYNGYTIVTPINPNPLVFKDQLTEISLPIDGLSSFSIDTFSLWGGASWEDSFSDQSKIQESSNLVISEGKVGLATNTDGYYFPSGYLMSTEITPSNLVKWHELVLTEFEPPDTSLKYQIYYSSAEDWLLVPDAVLPENSAGFDYSSPIDLSGLSTTTYSQLKLKGIFSTNLVDATPILDDWQVSWKTSVPNAVPYAAYSLRGNKIVGYDAEEEPIYKYSADSSSDSGGHDYISNLEWDFYAFSVNPAEEMDLVLTDPQPQPFNLAPSSNMAVKLYFKAENSLLVVVQDTETLESIFGASCRLYNSGLGYDTTQYTNENGQTYFIPLTGGTYNLEVQAEGYSPDSSQVFVSGDEIKTIKITETE